MLTIFLLPFLLQYSSCFVPLPSNYVRENLRMPLHAQAASNGIKDEGADLPQPGDLLDTTVKISEADLLPQAPALSFQKYLTMQEKRVVVTIRYSAEAGWKPYFLTVAKKLKESHPDIVIERRILPQISDEESEVFEVRVDGKVVLGNQLRKLRPEARSVYVSMVELDLAISRARRRQRPSTAYGIV